MVELSWLVGLDGSTFDGETSEWGLSPWDPLELKADDVVKVQGTPKGVKTC